MKKILFIVLVLALMLTGCNKNDTVEQEDGQEEIQEDTVEIIEVSKDDNFLNLFAKAEGKKYHIYTKTEYTYTDLIASVHHIDKESQLYADIKDTLTQKGVNEDYIIILHEYNSPLGEEYETYNFYNNKKIATFYYAKEVEPEYIKLVCVSFIGSSGKYEEYESKTVTLTSDGSIDYFNISGEGLIEGYMELYE